MVANLASSSDFSLYDIDDLDESDRQADGLILARVSSMAAALCDQLHRRPAGPVVIPLAVKLLSPGQGRHIAVLVHRLIRDEMQLFADRRTTVRVGSMIEQQSRERGIALPSA